MSTRRRTRIAALENVVRDVLGLSGLTPVIPLASAPASLDLQPARIRTAASLQLTIGPAIEHDSAMPLIVRRATTNDSAETDPSRLAVEARALAIAGLAYPIGYDFSGGNRWVGLGSSVVAYGIAWWQMRS